jgi:hypothetical protein
VGGTEENCDYFDICACGFCMAKPKLSCAHIDYENNCENSAAWPKQALKTICDENHDCNRDRRYKSYSKTEMVAIKEHDGTLTEHAMLSEFIGGYTTGGVYINKGTEK